MKKESKQDLRYRKTESLIQHTFRDMLREMDFSQITVRELTERAMINRKTFYLHYESLDALLGRLQADIYDNVLQSLSDIAIPGDLGKLMRELFLFGAHTDDISERILCARGNFLQGTSPEKRLRQQLFHYSQPKGREIYTSYD